LLGGKTKPSGAVAGVPPDPAAASARKENMETLEIIVRIGFPMLVAYAAVSTWKILINWNA
jgi:hypothetical protein